MKIISRKQLTRVLAAVIALSIYGCSGDQETQEAVEVDSQQGQQEQEEVVQEEIAQEEIVQEEAAEETADTSSITDGQRVVRFAKTSGVSVWSDSTASHEVGELRQGDTILVVEDGEWAKISDSMWVKTAELSNKAIAREHKKKSWISPSH